MMLRTSANHFVQAAFFVALAVAMVSAQDSLGSSYCQTGAGCVTTFHNDLARDGVYGNETTLKASSFTGFSGLTTVALDGLVYAQPLYIHGLKGITAGNGCNHTQDNVIFAATNNTVYAINSSGTICWQVTLDASIGSAVPYDSLPLDSDNASGNFCNNVVAQAGITGTPVIDTSVTPPILYIVTKVAITGGGYAHKLHALRTDSHAELPHFPVDVTTALGGSSAFNSLLQNQRSGLALSVSGSTASVYVTFGSYCDSNYISGSGLQTTVYNGLVVEFQYTYFGNSAPTVSTFKAEKTANDSNKGGILMAGGAPAVDSNGNLYVTVGNGYYDGVDEWGESVLKLQMGSSPSVSDWYTPSIWSILNTGTSVGQTVCIGSPSCTGGLGTQVSLNSGDWDLGAGGVVLLNPVSVSIPSSASEYIASGKEGIGYLGFYSPTTSYMGHLDGSNVTNAACTTTTTPSSTSGAVAQCFPVMNGNYTGSQPDTGNRATPAFLGTDASDNYLYVAGIGDNLRGYSMCSNGLFNFPISGVNSCSATAPAVSAHQFGYPGASPVVSWNKTGAVSDAIVWVLDPANHYGKITFDTHHNASSVQSSYAALYAYKAVPDTTSTGCSTTAPCMTKLWDSTGLTDPGPGAVKFAMPTVVDGMVIVGGGNNNPYYSPGSTVGTTNCSKSSPSRCGALVIYHN